METFKVHTHFTNSVQVVHNIRLDDLLEPQTRALLKAAFNNPEALRPGITREALTATAAERFSTLAKSLRDERHHDAHAVAHFITRILFCLFAEDIGLLPERLFTRLLESARKRPEKFVQLASRLFSSMSTGGDFDLEDIGWFNGGLFDDAAALPLTRADGATFGILHSRFHECWALRSCTSLGKGNDPRYTPTATFETFPFPESMTPNLPAAEVLAHPLAPAIADAARELNRLRENWLNPPDLVHRVPEVVSGFPDRILPNDDRAAAPVRLTGQNRLPIDYQRFGLASNDSGACVVMRSIPR